MQPRPANVKWGCKMPEIELVPAGLFHCGNLLHRPPNLIPKQLSCTETEITLFGKTTTKLVVYQFSYFPRGTTLLPKSPSFRSSSRPVLYHLWAYDTALHVPQKPSYWYTSYQLALQGLCSYSGGSFRWGIPGTIRKLCFSDRGCCRRWVLCLICLTWCR